MAAVSSSASSHLLHHVFLRPPPPTTSPSSMLSIFFCSRSSPFRPLTTPIRIPSSSFSFTSLSPPRPLLSSSLISLSLSSHPQSRPSHSLSNSNSDTVTPIKDQLEYESVDAFYDGEDEESEENLDSEEEEEKEEEKEEMTVNSEGSEIGDKPDLDSVEVVNEVKVEETVNGEVSERVLESSALPVPKLPALTMKEKKDLASYAHSLGKKLKSQQVGKSGVTDMVATALIETLESKELLKLKIHNSCPGELDDVVKQLEKSTGSVAVGQIGRTVILYRPSLTKMKAEEKNKENQKAYARKQQAYRSKFQNREQVVPRFSGRGRRGSSRNPTMSDADYP